MVVALATLTAANIHRRATALEEARLSWGKTVDVWVASRDLEVGEPVAGNVRRVETPEALVAPSSLTRPVGTVRQMVDEGTPLTRADVSVRTDELALVPEGWAAVAVIERIGSGAQIGDRVDVTSEGVTIAQGALVIGEVDEATLLAVPAATAAALTSANTTTEVSLIRYPDR